MRGERREMYEVRGGGELKEELKEGDGKWSKMGIAEGDKGRFVWWWVFWFLLGFGVVLFVGCVLLCWWVCGVFWCVVVGVFFCDVLG
jgi:hypothetical protein